MNISTDSTGCVGNKIKVAAGHYVDIAHPSPGAIDLATIAAALSKLCRFGGHVPHFYSVAEHSILATTLAIRDGVSGEALRAVLLHDAAEAYIGDVVQPLKRLLPAYLVVEQRITQAVGQAFGIDFERWHSTVKEYDLMMVKAEKLAFWPDDCTEWDGFAEIRQVAVGVMLYMPIRAEVEFLRLANHLGVCKHDENSGG